MRGDKATNLGRQLFPKRKCRTLEADIGSNVDGQVGAGKGGVCTIFHENLAPLVSDSGSFLRNRAFWVRLKGLPGGDLGILNLYAPNDSQGRIALWHELLEILPSDYRWLVSGDFNMLESAQDKSTLCSKLMSNCEKLVWEAFKSSFHLSDTFAHTGKLRFTWDNKRRDGSRILGRLDRHYVSSVQGSNLPLPTRNYVIKGDCPASDHLPVSIEIVLQATDQRKSCYKMSSLYLHCAEVRDAVKRIWSPERRDSSTFSRLRRFSHFYRAFCKRQAAESRRKETEARSNLATAQETLQADPQNLEAQTCLAQRQAHFLTFETRKAEGRRLRSRIRWREKGDSMTKEFFNAIKEKPPRSSISELLNPDGNTSHSTKT